MRIVDCKAQKCVEKFTCVFMVAERLAVQRFVTRLGALGLSSGAQADIVPFCLQGPGSK